MATDTTTESRRVRHNNDAAENPLHKLTDEQVEAIGKEFDELHERVQNDLGARDAAYIRGIISLQRRLALLGRVLLVPSRSTPAWILGTSVLGLAKIIENMEIGHNVLHGQWDWMNDPVINSQEWDWDTASTADSWRHSHNYIHHTYTNIRGLDKDLGYEIMRIDPEQKWHPVYLAQPLYNIALMVLFEWGVALHDMDLEAVFKREKPIKEILEDLRGISGKARLQAQKDYVAWPALSALVSAGVFYASAASSRDDKVNPRRRGRRARPSFAPSSRGTDLTQVIDTARGTFTRTLWANATANIIRNVWTYAIIFCGHFPDQTYTFSQDETEDESRGARHVRQLLGAANIEGSPLFHVLSGNLGYQVEHHLYPDMPSTRYGEIAPQVREICKRYELPYNSGPFFQQIGMVQRTILRLAFPGGKPRPKPGPYDGPTYMTKGERELRDAAVAASE